MNTKKIGMHEFIVNFFKVINRTTASIYMLLDAICPVARTANLMLYDGFDNTLESLLEPVLTYPEYFELTLDAESIKLKNDVTLDELVKMWPIDSSVIATIEFYLQKYDNPMMYAGVSLDYAAQNEKYISSSTKYVDWLWDRLEQNYKPNTRLLKTSCRMIPSDIANISRLSNLYTLLSRYYSQNMMDCFGDGKMHEGYVFKYTRNGEERYFKLERLKTCDIRGGDISYRVEQHKPVPNAPYFPDVALSVPSQLLAEREEVYKQIKELFVRAKSISLRYDAIAYDLGIIYGRIDDPRD